MTERKPAGVSFETWADKQFRDAEARGEFENLPGFGKPLPGLDAPYDDMWWVKEKMQREQLSYLPPTLALRKEAEDTLAAVVKSRSEREVRQLLEDLNEKIRECLRRPAEGPPLRLAPFDVDRAVRDWRAKQSR